MYALNMAMVLPDRVKTPSAPRLCVETEFWTALTRRPRPALVAPAVTPSEKGERSWYVSCCCCCSSAMVKM